MGIYTHTIYLGKYTSPMDGMGLDFFCASVILASSFLGGAKVLVVFWAGQRGWFPPPKKLSLFRGFGGVRSFLEVNLLPPKKVEDMRLRILSATFRRFLKKPRIARRPLILQVLHRQVLQPGWFWCLRSQVLCVRSGLNSQGMGNSTQ